MCHVMLFKSRRLLCKGSIVWLLLKLVVNLLYFRVRKWLYLKSNIEGTKLEARKFSSAQSSAE